MDSQSLEPGFFFFLIIDKFQNFFQIIYSTIGIRKWLVFLDYYCDKFLDRFSIVEESDFLGQVTYILCISISFQTGEHESIFSWILLSHFSHVRLCVTPWRQPTRLPRPWDSSDKNTGVGCHFLLQCMKVKNQSEVAQSCPTLSDPRDFSPPGSSIHRIFQARVLEWGAIAFSTHGF